MEKTKGKGWKGGWGSHKEINSQMTEKENVRARLTEHRGEGAE